MQSSIARKPPALRVGDTIAFVSPSSRLNKLFAARIAKATHFFEGQGFRVKEIYTETLSEDHLQSIQQRCEELHEAFADPQVKAIICTIGGLAANELLPHLDYGLIRKNPKIFCGYSDITLLHHALFTQAGLRTFYGPAVIPVFGESPIPLDFTVEHFLRMLTQPSGDGFVQRCIPRSSHYTQEFLNWMSEEGSQRAREMSPSPAWKWLRPGRATGRLFGGCLPSLVQLCGTRYLPEYEGRVLVLETPEGEKPGTPYLLDAARTAVADLRNAGVLEVIAGLVVGRPYMYNEAMTAAFEKMLFDQCYGTGFPILVNIDTGHTDPMLTLPLDALVSLDSDSIVFPFTLDEEVVVPCV